MQNLVEHMAEIELGRFSVNGYRGLPDAPPFSVVEGELPIIVSAPHAVSQLHEHLERHGKTVSLNACHAARSPNTVTHAIARKCSVAALQFEISSPFRVPIDAKGHVPPGEDVPFTSDQLPVELAARRNPDPACVEDVVRALAGLAQTLVC